MQCGTRVQVASPVAAPSAAPMAAATRAAAPKTRRRSLWWLPVGLLLVIAAAAVVFAVLLKLPQRVARLPAGQAPTGQVAPESIALTPVPPVTASVGSPLTPGAAPSLPLPQQLSEAQARASAGAWQDVAAITGEIRKADATFQAEEVKTLRATACANLARQAEQAGDVAASQRWWACVLNERPDDAAARAGQRRADAYLSGRTAWEAKDFAGAIASWQSLYSEAASYADVADRLYLAYLAYGDQLCARESSEDIQKAREQYGLARQLLPARPEALDKLRQCQLPTPTPTFTPTPLPGPHLGQLTGADTLRVRSGPGANYFVVGNLNADTLVTILGRTSDSRWIYIEAGPEQRGWVAGEYLKANYPLAAAPVTPAPPLARSIQVAQSGLDFSSQQGTNDWFYVFSNGPGLLTFTRMPWDTTTGKWYRWCCDARYDPEMRLSKTGGHPSQQYDVARLWVSPYEGTLRITGRAAKESGDGLGGNGVVVRIVQKKTILWEQRLASYDATGVGFDLPIAVMAGDEFYFVISALGNSDKDNTIFDITIALQAANGTDQPPPVRWPEVSLQPPLVTPAPPASPGLVCYEPRLRHFEEHKGCCAEIVGVVYDAQGRPSGPRGAVVRVEGPPGGNQYVHEFGVDPGGGYSVTALSVAAYTISLRGTGISSKKFAVKYINDATIRAVVDFYQAPCN